MNMSKLLTAPCELLAVLPANVESFASLQTCKNGFSNVLLLFSTAFL